MGSIDSYSLMDGQGKFTSSYTSYFEPMFYSSWKEHKDNKFISYSHDVKQYIGKSFELNGTGYFIPLEDNPDDFYEYVVWEQEAQRAFNNEKIKLLDIHMISQYYVELQNSERGLLYFWIGD